MAYYQHLEIDVTGGTSIQVHKSFISNALGDLIANHSTYFNVSKYANTTLASSNTNACELESTDGLVKLFIHNANANAMLGIDLWYIQRNVYLSTATLYYQSIKSSYGYEFLSQISLEKLYLKDGIGFISGNVNILSILTTYENLNSGNLRLTIVGNVSGGLLPCCVADGLNIPYWISAIVQGVYVENQEIVKHSMVLTNVASTSPLNIKKIVKNLIGSSSSIGYSGFLQIENEVYYHTGFMGFLLEDR